MLTMLISPVVLFVDFLCSFREFLCRVISAEVQHVVVDLFNHQKNKRPKFEVVFAAKIMRRSPRHYPDARFHSQQRHQSPKSGSFFLSCR
jgi:hypothetical protein